MSDVSVTMTMLSATQSVAVFTSLLPPIADVRKTVNDPSTINDVHMAELLAGGIVVGIGLIGSMMVKSPAPAMIAIACAMGMVVMYESVLQSTPKEARA